MIDFILLTILAIFSVTDIHSKTVPNVLMFPAIFAGLLTTGFWIPMLTAFFLLAYLAEDGRVLRWAGGDVKLFAMIAVFKGWLFLPIALVTYLVVNIYRRMTNDRQGLPLAPFAYASTVTILIITATLKWIVH